ncbi:MAG: adenylyltransferase/cytidyltransferase family protein [Candidatus Krumholzibacteria bacterium]|nr:adenylyltransferase/cytidyltransferase family protein [Candidatus Krumholzibacteria bacterium]
MMGTDRKIFYDIESLMDEIARSHGPKKEVVLANGCFDILHVGHVRYLSEAAEYGDILVVAINDDESTRRLKGVGRPVIPGDERAEILTALSYVDYVLLFSESTVDGIIRKLRPSVHAKGTDYTEESVPEADTAKESGCRTVITGDPKDHSSRDIIKKMQEE